MFRKPSAYHRHNYVTTLQIACVQFNFIKHRHIDIYGDSNNGNSNNTKMQYPVNKSLESTLGK